MSFIHILDCTLRDGGYCNQWKFGSNNINLIINGLTEANIDIVECGFISEKINDELEISKYNSVERVVKYLPKNHNNTKYVVMMNYGEFNVKNIPVCSENTVDGIRVAFHKKDYVNALKQCRILKKKGYMTFIQAMVTMSYSDQEYLDLISAVNKIKPYAFYIVDSFGMMKKRDILRYCSLVEHNLNEKIVVGFHAHNNLQLAYSNTLTIIDMLNRDLIIDSSIYGMGRGAGNLNTELFVNYLNEEFNTDYRIEPILMLMDEVINKFHQKTYWGYSLPNYLSAIYNIHPNYAGYLSDKNTLTINEMNFIFNNFDSDKKTIYDKAYVEDLYFKYMCDGEIRKHHIEELSNTIHNKKILLIAPGKSSYNEREKIICEAKKKNVVSISINFNYQYFNTDMIFISNFRRYHSLNNTDKMKCIVTSNISDDKPYVRIDYKKYINDNEFVRDNAGLMLIKYLLDENVEEILLAGFDGYSCVMEENYIEPSMTFLIDDAYINNINNGLSAILTEYSKRKKISFLTKPKYVFIDHLT